MRLSELRSAMSEYSARFDPALVSATDAARVVEDASAIEKMAATVKSFAAARVAETDLWKRDGDRSSAQQVAVITDAAGADPHAEATLLEQSRTGVSENCATRALARRRTLVISRHVGVAPTSAAACAPGATPTVPRICICRTTRRSSPGSWRPSSPFATNCSRQPGRRVGESQWRRTQLTRSPSSPVAPIARPMGNGPGASRSLPASISPGDSAASRSATRSASSPATGPSRSQPSAT